MTDTTTNRKATAGMTETKESPENDPNFDGFLDTAENLAFILAEKITEYTGYRVEHLRFGDKLVWCGADPVKVEASPRVDEYAAARRRAADATVLVTCAGHEYDITVKRST